MLDEHADRAGLRTCVPGLDAHIPPRFSSRVSALESHHDRDEYVDGRIAHATRLEPPLPGGRDGFLVESRIQRAITRISPGRPSLRTISSSWTEP
jgi:hypothetical protein